MSSNLLIYGFCFLIMCILLLGINLNSGKKTETSAGFSYLLYSSIFYVVSYFLSELLEGNTELRLLNFVFNYLAFLSVDFTVLCFTVYLEALLKEKGPYSDRLLKAVRICSYVRMGLITVLALFGQLFLIVNGYYTEQPLAWIPYLYSFIVLLLLLLTVIRNRKSFSTRQFYVIISYIALPLVPIILELITDYYFLSILSVTLSVLMVYVLIQATEIEEGKIRQDMLEEVSTTDLLTHLNNRRSYYLALSRLDPGKNLGILFCDLNGLKRTNDLYGHKAGDELIEKFSRLLTENYRKEEVFRISGDEFVVLVPNVSEQDFQRRLIRFKSDTVKANNIAAVGFSYGSGSRVDFLIQAAEESMYSDKQQYYEKTNQKRRVTDV